MSQHHREANKKQVDRSPTEIFRFPSRDEMRKAKEQEQARLAARNQPVVNNYKDEDLSGCLSGCLSGSLKTPQQPTKQPKAYQDEDLSGCLSGALNPRNTRLNTSQRDRFTPTQRNVRTGEINSIEQDDLSAAIDSLNVAKDSPEEEKSGWLYFN
jgi:hypothetical protein